MRPLHIWPQPFDNRGYDGSFTVPSVFGFMPNKKAFPSLPLLGCPNICGSNASSSLKTILDVTKPIDDKATGKQERLSYLNLEKNTRAFKFPLDEKIIITPANSNNKLANVIRF